MYMKCVRRSLEIKKSFLLLDQKVNKKFDVYGHNADDSSSDLCPWPWDDAGAQVPARHLDCIVLFDLYSKFQGYLIRYSISDSFHP